MSTAIETVSCIVAFVSEQYQSSINCKLELLYAVYCKKPLIFVFFHRRIVLETWLKDIIGEHFVIYPQEEEENVKKQENIISDTIMTSVDNINNINNIYNNYNNTDNNNSYSNHTNGNKSKYIVFDYSKKNLHGVPMSVAITSAIRKVAMWTGKKQFFEHLKPIRDQSFKVYYITKKLIDEAIQEQLSLSKKNEANDVEKKEIIKNSHTSLPTTTTLNNNNNNNNSSNNNNNKNNNDNNNDNNNNTNTNNKNLATCTRCNTQFNPTLKINENKCRKHTAYYVGGTLITGRWVCCSGFILLALLLLTL
jgi:hypothetical protein